ncbi:MAG: OmpA family protein [Granulosicoccus sp.]|nr:OmpA family protein [Granulosicoccus sp.]
MSLLTRSLIALLAPVFFSTATWALEDTWHVAIGTGLSVLNPDTSRSQRDLEDDQSTAYGFNMGLDINPVITAELGLTELGSAALSDGESIEYRAVSLGAVAYFWGEKEAHYRQEGASSYLRFGLSLIENESALDLESSDETAFWIGLGAQWPINNQWSLRAEVSSFDGDANAAMASLVWRNAGFNSSGPRRNPLVRIGQSETPPDNSDPVTDSELASSERESAQNVKVQIEPTELPQPAQVITSQEVQPVASQASGDNLAQSALVEPVALQPISRQRVAASDNTAGVSALAGDSVDNSQTRIDRQVASQDKTAMPASDSNTRVASLEQRPCFSSVMRTTVSQSACTVLNGVLAGLDFKPRSGQITFPGRASLDRVASALKRYPRAVVELQVHTQAFAEPDLADRLARERVMNVARYLVEQGVQIGQLRARSYGSSRPRADNSTAEGRRANDRLEVKLL